MVKSMPLHLLFFCSGLSGLLYQVVWVRQFGHIYGNTVHSASIVVAILMVGLGAGSYLLGACADRRYASRPKSLVSVYALLESVIAGCGLPISLALPHLAATVARLSSYEIDSAGWHTLTTASYLWRGAITIALLAPMTVLMGGTFTVLIRARVHSDLGSSGWRIDCCTA
jgi:spermidine synthase